MMKTDERVSIALRALYQSYGYRPYKVSRFEEYDLYMRNKRFLTSEHVLAFSDMDGRLLALKPDVTLSVVKNTRDEDAPIRLCYAESVYRVPKNACGFREIMQTGVECIGGVDDYASGEVLMLAARSLAAISPSYALDVADMSIPAGVLADAEEGLRGELLALIAQKNLHGLTALCEEAGVNQKTRELLGALIANYGPLEQTLDAFEAMALPPACQKGLGSLRRMERILSSLGIDGVNLDFSVVNDMNYYDGLVFTGFVDGVPSAVLRGGRYDRLMEKMGRRSQALGFAVYLDQLERLSAPQEGADVDVLVVYEREEEAQAAALLAAQVVAGGESVRVQRGARTALRYGRLLRVGEDGR